MRVLCGLRLYAVDDEMRLEKEAEKVLKHVTKSKATNKAIRNQISKEERRDAESGLRESMAVVDPAERRRWMRETLHEVALVYARVLRTALDDIDGQVTSGKDASMLRTRANGAKRLLPATLSGLAAISPASNDTCFVIWNSKLGLRAGRRLVSGEDDRECSGKVQDTCSSALE